jgi:hypothetical protein
MQITPNDPGADSVEETSTTNALPEGQEQVVLVLDLRRALPESGENNSIPDLGLFLADYDPEQAQALSFLLDSVVEVLGFDPTLSRVSLSDDGNAITLSDLESVVAGLSPSSEPVEIQTEQAIDTGVTVAVDSEGVAEVLESTDPTPEEGDSEPIPEVVEDVPHDQEPEDAGEITIDELVENGTIAPPLDTPEDSPVGDSVAADPGPVDPPTEG